MDKPRLATWVTISGLIVLQLLWLWPIGLGGQMPLGGDVTQFYLGVDAFLAESIREGWWPPVWNDLWGFGFPGVAESQMGVYYPIHGLLYGLLSVETAYTISLIGHTLLGGLGAFWAARRFGLNHWSSLLGGWAFAGSGFFVIHLSHQWSYTVGCWMPWALGLAWSIVSGQGGWRSAFALAAVLAWQILPGHFQLAWMTQVVVLFVAAWSLVERHGASWTSTLWRVFLILGAWLASLVLAMAQLLPTWELAQVADPPQTVSYLGSFSGTPLHLINLVAPELFHVSPLWRSIAWDPWHATPEEYQLYVGLVPLSLAIVAVIRGFIHDRRVRVLTMIGLVSLLFSLGPYLPGYSRLIDLPGFGQFRAPGRWEVVVSLALAMLAGLGLDQWQRPQRTGRWFIGIGLAGLLCLVGWLVLVEWMTSGSRYQVPATFDRSLARVLDRSPWPELRLDQLRQASAARQYDERVRQKSAKMNIHSDLDPAGLTFLQERGTIYGRELVPAAIGLCLLIILGMIARWRYTPILLLVVAAIDLLWLAQVHQPFDTIPLGSLRSGPQSSTVLERLAVSRRGTRVITPASNLPMLAGMGVTQAYRTLDLPSGRPWTTSLVTRPFVGEGQDSIRRTLQRMRLTNTNILLLDPQLVPLLKDLKLEYQWGSTQIEEIADPILASAIYGKDWVDQDPAARSRFGWVEFGRLNRNPPGVISQLSVFPVPVDWQAENVLELGETTEGLVKANAVRPDRYQIDLGELERPEGMLVIPMLYHPRWQAWASARPASAQAEAGLSPITPTSQHLVVRPILDHWLAIELPVPTPEDGDNSSDVLVVNMAYDRSLVLISLAGSLVAWTLTVVGYAGLSWWTRRRSRRKNSSTHMSEKASL